MGNALKNPLGAVAGAAKFQAKTMVGLVTGVKGALGGAKKGIEKGKEGAKSTENAIGKVKGVATTIATLGGKPRPSVSPPASPQEPRSKKRAALETIRDIVSPMNLLKEMIGGKGIIGNWLAQGFEIGGLRIALGGKAVEKMFGEMMNYHAKKKNDEIMGKFEGYQELDRRSEECKRDIAVIEAKITWVDKEAMAAERKDADIIALPRGLIADHNKTLSGIRSPFPLGKTETREELVTERRELQEKVQALDSRIGELHEELEGKSLLAGSFGIEGVFAVQTVNRIVEREGKLELEEDETFAGRKIPGAGALLTVFKALNLVSAVPSSLYIMKFEFGKLGLQGTTMSGIDVVKPSEGESGESDEEETRGQELRGKIMEGIEGRDIYGGGSQNEEISEELQKKLDTLDKEYGVVLDDLEGYKKLSDETQGKLDKIKKETNPVKQREMLRDFERKEMPRLKALSESLAGAKEETGST